MITGRSESINVRAVPSHNKIPLIQSNRLQTKIKANENDNRSIKSKASSQWLMPKNTNSHHYVFSENSMFYPNRLPIRYGFRIRPLLKHHHLPSWQLDPSNPNLMTYQHEILSNQDFLDREILKPNISVPIHSDRKPSHLITCPIEHHWFQSLLNSNHQQNQEHRQLSPTVHQFSYHRSTTSSKLISRQRRSCNSQRTKRMSFNEHLEKYYVSKYLLTTTIETCPEKSSIVAETLSCQSSKQVCSSSVK